MTPPFPIATRTLLVKLDEGGWSQKTTQYEAPAEFSALSDTPRGDGTRERIRFTEVCDHVMVLARHADGRGFVAFWLRRPGRGWSLDLAIRGRHAGEYTPHQIKAKALTAYVTAPDVVTALAAVGGPVTLDVLRGRLESTTQNGAAA